jgi:hypothetical protein
LKYALNFYKKHESITFIGDLYLHVYECICYAYICMCMSIDMYIYMGGDHLDVTSSDLGSILKYALNCHKKHKSITFIGNICIHIYECDFMYTLCVCLYSYLYGWGSFRCNFQ